MTTQQGAAFDEFVQGGLLDDADVQITGARFTTWDYNGKQPQPVLAVKLSMRDREGNDHEQYLSSGELRFFVPSADGKFAVPVGNQQKLNLNTNAVAFILSVLNASTDATFSNNLKTGDISTLEGSWMHVVRKAQPKRTGIVQAPGTEGQPQREKTQLICEKMLSYPGQAAPAAGAAPKAAPATTASAPAAAAPANSDLDDQTVGALLQLLSDNGGTLKVSAIAGKLFSSPAFKDGGAMPLTGPARNAVLGLIVKPEFLGAPDRPWKFENGEVKLG